MSRFLILFSLYILFVPLISFADDAPIPRRVLTRCLALGEMTMVFAGMRDAGMPMPEALARHRATRPAQPIAMHKTEDAMAELAYHFPTWTPEQLHNKAVAECLTQELGQ